MATFESVPADSPAKPWERASASGVDAWQRGAAERKRRAAARARAAAYTFNVSNSAIDALMLLPRQSSG
jgi:hypothetical protein